MATTAEYLTQLQKDKESLINTLSSKGIETSESDTFTTLAVKTNTLGSPSDYFKTYNINSGTPYTKGAWTNFVKKIPYIEATFPKFTSLFYSCPAEEIDVSGLNVTVDNTSARNMFYKCTNLTNLIIGEKSWIAIKDLTGMFTGCAKLTSVDFSKQQLVNANFFGSMFSGCTSLTNVDISSCTLLKEGSVQTITDMFKDVPVDCYILVANSDCKNYLTTKFPTLTNIHYVGEETSK